ncbi:hypothetical protein [Maridesulfovibrio sp. FT414]|uniref:hypothetical protein n=1 Tax=Maridesulfovibrio sp. FT414 TaxID=2979469 RepID=UPI003D801CA4
MSGSKQLTDRFLVALFRRGKADFLPASYLKAEGDKVLARGESDRLPELLAGFVEEGICEERGGEFRLIKDPFA